MSAETHAAPSREEVWEEYTEAVKAQQLALRDHQVAFRVENNARHLYSFTKSEEHKQNLNVAVRNRLAKHVAFNDVEARVVEASAAWDAVKGEPR